MREQTEQKVAEGDRRRQLSVKQERAIELLLVGKGDAEVAKAVGVSRQTVNEWRNHDALFIAELNLRRQQVWEAALGRLRGLLGQAIAVLEEDLNAEDRRIRQAAAIHVLRCLGVYRT